MAENPKFDRGTLLSIFKSDRAEDLVALACALLIVIGTVMFIPR
jgi:hypothetical protein